MPVDDGVIDIALLDIATITQEMSEATEAARVRADKITRLSLRLVLAQQRLERAVESSSNRARAGASAAAVPVDLPATAALPSLLTTRDVATMFAKTQDTIREWIETGKLDGVKIHGYWHVKRESALALLEQ